MPSRYFWIPRLTHWLKTTIASKEEKEECVSGDDHILTRIPCSLVDVKLQFQGYWDADKNDPRIEEVGQVSGHYYIVSKESSLQLNGRSLWPSGTMVIFDGHRWRCVDVSKQLHEHHTVR